MIYPAAMDIVDEPRPTALYAATASASSANSWVAVNGWSVARLYSRIEEEYEALTSAAGAIDLGALCRYTLRGVEAAQLGARLTSAPVADLSVGESARGLILDSDGAVVDICDVLRLSGDLFFLTTSIPCDRRLQVAARGFDAVVENITSAVAVLGLVGPNAREAAKKAGFDLGSDMLAAQGRIRGVETAVRPIALGRSPGVEIIYPADEALVLWERVRRAAAPQPVGLDACEIVRIEGGAPRAGLDFDTADRAPLERKRLPIELGLPHLAPTNRAWFNGRRALPGKLGRYRLVTLTVDADTAPVGAMIFAKTAIIGRVTSSAYSPHYRAALCFAEIERSAIDKGLTIAIGPNTQIAAELLETHESGLAAAFRARERLSTESGGRRV